MHCMRYINRMPLSKIGPHYTGHYYDYYYYFCFCLNRYKVSEIELEYRMALCQIGMLVNQVYINISTLAGYLSTAAICLCIDKTF